LPCHVLCDQRVKTKPHGPTSSSNAVGRQTALTADISKVNVVCPFYGNERKRMACWHTRHCPTSADNAGQQNNNQRCRPTMSVCLCDVAITVTSRWLTYRLANVFVNKFVLWMQYGYILSACQSLNTLYCRRQCLSIT